MNNTTEFDAANKIWYGSKSEVTIDKNQNFGEIIVGKLDGEDSERMMQIDGDTGEALTRAEIRRRTIRCAQNLTKLGCGLNQRIAIIARNHHNLTPLIYAAFCIGSPISPMDIIVIQDGAPHILERLEPSFIFCDADVLLAVEKIATDIDLNAKLFSVRGLVDGFDSIDRLMNATGNEDSFVCARINDSFSHPAIISCSSRATGMVKSICISHAALIHKFSSEFYSMPVTGLSISSLSWFSAVMLLLSPPFGSTIRVFTSQPFSTDLFFDLIEKYTVHFYLGCPFQVQSFVQSERCKKADLSSLLALYLIGSSIPSSLLDTLKQIIPQCAIITTYGLTEIGGRVTVTSPGELDEYPNSVGSLIAGVQMKIIDENTSKNCGIGEIGEIYVKCAVPTLGYFRDENANRNACDEDGYFITGDIGYFDGAGRLFIDGRKKDIFKHRSSLICPTEIENVIQTSQAVYQSFKSVCTKMFNTFFDENEKIWSGAEIELKINKHQNFGEIILEKLADADSNRVMQINGDTGETLTKADVHERTIRCAQHLIALGYTQNQQITIIARNHHNLTPLLFAAFCIGSPICPLDVVSAKDGASDVLRRMEPSFIFCDADIISGIEKIVNDLSLSAKIFTVNGTVEGFDSIDSLMISTGNESSFVCTKIDDAYSHVALISSSSGTTGQSKLICMSHAFLTHMFIVPVDEFSVLTLCFSSLYWLSGICVLIMSAFESTRVFTAQPFSADLFFDLVEKHKVQFFVGVPYQFQAIVKSERCKNANLSSVLVFFSIGAHVPSVLAEILRELLPNLIFLNSYGMAEVGGGICGTYPKELDEYPTTVGSLRSGVHVKIVDENTNERCGIGEMGEIYVKSPISISYFRDEIATKNAYDKDGYFISGDIGHFDDTGRIYISGRKKEMFKNRNFPILPAEIEDIIQKHQAVQFACVVNVYDDKIMSDLVAAVVVRNERYSITADEIYTLIANQLNIYKHLDGGVYFVDELPITPSGKVSRSKVKELAENFYRTKKQQTNAASA